MQCLAQPAGAVLDITGQEADPFPTTTGACTTGACASGRYRYDPWRDFARLLKLAHPGADGLVELSLSGGCERLPGAAHGLSHDARPAGPAAATEHGRD